MRLSIRHETIYRYSTPAYYSIQQLRLTPRTEPQQWVLAWRIDAPRRLQRFTDAYGNVTHTLVLTDPHESIRVVVSGTIDIGPWEGTSEPLDWGPSPFVFGVATRLTAPEEPVRAFAAKHLRRRDRAADFLSLAEGICSAVAYESGFTEATSTAAQALELGRGVCQDHAHIFIAVCRAAGIPARYVSGYVDPGHNDEAASHAWADVWTDREGWVSVDITHRELVRDRHCRLAIGRDYLSAAPVRGIRTGGGEESLQVRVSVLSEQ